jgi:hypothetical protein
MISGFVISDAVFSRFKYKGNLSECQLERYMWEPM